MTDEAEDYELEEVYNGTITSPFTMVYYTQILNLVFKKSHMLLYATVDSLQIMGCIYNSDGKIGTEWYDLQYESNVATGTKTSQS